MDAPAAFGHRHALDAMHAGFEFQPGEHAAPGDAGHHLLDAAQAGIVELQRLEAPAAQGGIALIHAEQLRREQGRLLAAGAGAHFENGVLVVGLVLGQQGELHLTFERGQSFLEGVELRLGQVPHLGIFHHRRGFDHLFARLTELSDTGDHRFEFGHLLRPAHEILRVGRTVLTRQQRGQLGMAHQHAIQILFDVHCVICPPGGRAFAANLPPPATPSRRRPSASSSRTGRVADD